MSFSHIDEALEMLFNKEYNKVYTDDSMNFIDESEFNSLDDEWKEDYERMCQTMISGEKLPFDKLIERMKELQDRFRKM